MTDRPTRVRSSRSEEGAWELAEAPPTPALRGLVCGYVGFVETSRATLRRLEAPRPNPVLIVNFGVQLEVGAPGRGTAAYADSFVARLSDLPAITSFSGTSAGVQVDFTPLGLHRFCGGALHELPDPAVGLTDLLGAEGRVLTELLHDAPDWEARFDALDAFIERRVAASREPTPSVQWAWGALVSSAGAAPIGDLSDRLGCSRRHLIDGFREQIGVPPKTAARILRFARAARLARERPDVGLARVAAASGYHDQAHMSRDFRALAATTPAGYRAGSLPGFLGVPAGAPEVKSVQDPAPAAS